MGVDQAGQDDMLTGIEHFIAWRGRLLTDAEYFNDHAVLQHKAATGIEVVGGKNGEGVF
jgi:hypothetical protein